MIEHCKRDKDSGVGTFKFQAFTCTFVKKMDLLGLDKDLTLFGNILQITSRFITYKWWQIYGIRTEFAAFKSVLKYHVKISSETCLIYV